MKKALIAVIMIWSGIVSAAEYIIRDEIRGGVNQVILTSDERSSNEMIIFFVKEKVVEFQFRSVEHVRGIPISNPNSLRWTPITSNIFSIRFDSNYQKISSNNEILTASVNVWPACTQYACTEFPPKIIENARGRILVAKQPDGRIKYSLGLTKTAAEFENLYLLYQGSRRIAIEIDGRQYIFNIQS